MLSFPAQNWDKALAMSRANLKNAAFGRTASAINSRLYLSDYWTACNAQKLTNLGITHVISVIEVFPELPETIPQDQRLHIQILDQADANILEYLDTTTAFIKNALEESKENKVLVHCMQGISRSATVVCAYLVATTALTASAAIEHVRTIRGIVCPNAGFRHQLELYSTQYVKLKPQPLPLFKFGTSIAARIQKLKKPDKS